MTLRPIACRSRMQTLASEIEACGDLENAAARLVAGITKAERSGRTTASVGICRGHELHSSEAGEIGVIEAEIGFLRETRAEAGQRMVEEVEGRKPELQVARFLKGYCLLQGQIAVEVG